MARANDTNQLYYGLSAIRVKRAGVIVGAAEVVGSVQAQLAQELVATVGGAASYPIASRKGRSSGEGTLTLKSCPTWLDKAFNQASESVSAAAVAAASAVANITDAGTVSAGVAVSLKAGTADYMDVQITATAGQTVDVLVVGSNGAQEFKNVVIPGTGTIELGSTGVLLASGAAMTVGHVGSFSVSPQHGGQSVLSVPSVQHNTAYYELTCYSAVGGPSDAIVAGTFHKVMFAGVNTAMTDVETVGDMEIPFHIVAPSESSSVYTRRVISKPSA